MYWDYLLHYHYFCKMFYDSYFMDMGIYTKNPAISSDPFWN